MKTQTHPQSHHPKYFRLKNVLFLSPHYLWRKDQFVHFLTEDEKIETENSFSKTLIKKPAEVDEKAQYWHQFYD